MGVIKGDLVTIDYVGKFEDGTVFDTSIESVAKKAGIYNRKRIYEPIEFRVGSGAMIEGFEEAVLGMEMGNKKNVQIPPEKAYGQADPKKIKKFPLPEFKKQGIDPQIGQMFSVNEQAGTVTGIMGGEVEVDFNPPMAGKNLIFEITLHKILRNPEKVQI
jgi:FKBP-type peptidyl-prolyl cis-trans isomerase 2